MMAAATAASFGHEVILMEQNDKLGKKLYITGKGRCNITNACEVEELIEAMVHNPKFMYSSFYSYTNEQVIDFFNEHGVATKIERGNRVFPISDKSSDVILAMERACRDAGVEIRLGVKVTKLSHDGTRIYGVTMESGAEKADSVIIATGGLSYPVTGSTGDGYRMAKQVQHKIVHCQPGLVPMNVREEWVKALQGLSLKHVVLKLSKGTKELHQAFGEMMFTHFGITGPIVLTASSEVDEKQYPLQGSIDLKPKLNHQMLDERLLRDFAKYNRKDFANSLGDLLPKALIPVVIDLSGIEAHKKVDQITKEERLGLVDLLKGLPFTIEGKRSFKEAIITQGGVEVKEINPNTMASKKVEGLYFAGEVLDLDAVTGGYNLQIAYSTGYLAGVSIL